MNIKIKIECDSITDFLSHLDELRQQIVTQALVLKLDPDNDEFDVSVADELCDANCYGTHEVTMFKEI